MPRADQRQPPGNIRYARNAVSTAGLLENTELTVSVAFGKRRARRRSMSSTTSRWKKWCAARRTWRAWRRRIRSSCRRSSSRLQGQLPPSAKRLPPSIPSTARKWRPQHQRGEEAGLIAAGFFSDTTGFETVANSNGVFGYQT
jgi:hypothetical protein